VTQRYNSTVFDVLRDCGVQFVNLGDCPWAELTSDFIRQFIFFEFLMSNRFVINRVISADLFDTVFQKDPFITKFQADRVYYSSEANLIAGHRNNVFWLGPFISQAKVLFPGVVVSEEKINKRAIICAGLVAGGSGPMIQHLRLMLRMGDTKQLKAFGTDQGFLNFALGVGLVNFKYQLDPPNETFLATYGAHLNFEPLALGDKFGSMGKFGRIYNVLHQGDRSPQILNAILAVCPNFEPPFPDYVRAGYLHVRRRRGHPTWVFEESVP
jgi:hypothetical protein